jgi:hypothetical protein
VHLLFHRTTPWREAIRGSTNVLADLFAARGHAVTYVEGAAHPGHLLRRNRYAASWRRGPRHDAGAWVFTPLTLLPYTGTGALATPAAADRSYASAVPSISALAARGGRGPVDVVWSARPGGSALGRLFPDALLVAQVVDYYPAFGGATTRALEVSDYARADLVVTIGHALTDHVVNALGVPEEKVLTLGQGVFPERYDPALPEPPEWAGLPHPRAVWVGWTDKCDGPLFEAAARWLAGRGGSLLVVGGENAWARDLAARHPHVRLTGPRPPEATPPLLVHADLGLMLYDQTKPAVYRGQHPLKLYEYAAAGLAIVSTPHDEFRWLKPPVVEVARPEGVGGAFDAAWADRAAWGERGRAFAAAHDWRRKQEAAEAAIVAAMGRARAGRAGAAAGGAR